MASEKQTMMQEQNDSQAVHALREKVMRLQQLMAKKRSIETLIAQTNDDSNGESKKEKTSGAETVAAMASAGQKALSEFMSAAGEPITFVEAREIWNNMCVKNSGSFPNIEDSFMDITRYSLDNRETSESEDLSGTADLEEGQQGSRVNSNDLNIIEDNLSKIISELSDDSLEHFADNLAKGIKDTYSIRQRDDNSEFFFILGSMSLLWITVGSIAIAGYYQSETNPKLGTFNRVTIRSILMESFILFAVELLWECILSWIVLRYNIKINYTRKLGNLLKVPKYFVADLFLDFTSTALSMTTALAINQTLFCAMYYRGNREKVPFFSYVFLSQDRREDRPDTLIFQVTEDIMRFSIYFPFKLLVVDLIQSPAIIFIPIAVNNIGDGLAEPVGVAFGKHKYSTTALYYKGRFFHGNFTRSYEGSACVFFTTLIVVAANYHAFSTTQFWITMAFLPFLMTLAEAKAPHTNDGPFLALIGCGFLSAVFLLGR